MDEDQTSCVAHRSPKVQLWPVSLTHLRSPLLSVLQPHRPLKFTLSSPLPPTLPTRREPLHILFLLSRIVFPYLFVSLILSSFRAHFKRYCFQETVLDLLPTSRASSSYTISSHCPDYLISVFPLDHKLHEYVCTILCLQSPAYNRYPV